MGRIVHFEIPADNPDKLLEFFVKVFGWTYQRWGEKEYWLAETGSTGNPAINGAFLPRQDHFRSVVNTINVDDTGCRYRDY